MPRFSRKGIPGGNHHSARTTPSLPTAQLRACQSSQAEVLKEGHLGRDVGEGAPEAIEVEEEGGVPLDGVAATAAAAAAAAAGGGGGGGGGSTGGDILASGGGRMEHAVAIVVGVGAGGAVAGGIRAWGLVGRNGRRVGGCRRGEKWKEPHVDKDKARVVLVRLKCSEAADVIIHMPRQPRTKVMAWIRRNNARED